MFYNDSEESLKENLQLYRIVFYSILFCTSFFALNGLLFNGFNEYQLKPNIAGYLYLAVGVVTAILITFLKHTIRYPFLLLNITIIFLSLVSYTVGVNSKGSMLILYSSLVYLFLYISLIYYLKEDIDHQNVKSLSKRFAEKEFEKTAMGIEFGKYYLLGITGMHLLMIFQEVFF